MYMKQPTNAKIIEAIHASKGSVTGAARRLGVSRSIFYVWLEKDEALQTELAHAREQLCDMAEDVLIRHLEEGNLKAAMFVLNHFGRKKDLSKDEKDEMTPCVISPADIEAARRTVPDWIEPEAVA